MAGAVLRTNSAGGGGAGDASAANQSTQITAANLTNTRLGDITAPAVGSANYRLSLLATASQLPASLGAGGGLKIDGSGTALPVSAASLPLPTGAATAAGLTTINTTLGTPLQAGGTVVLGAGSALAGKVGIDQTTPGTTNNVTISGSTGTSVITSTQSADAKTSANTGLIAAAYGMVFNGTTWDRQRGDVNGAVNQPHAMAGNRWSYPAVSGGIVNTTTAVTIASAAGAGVRNYLTGLQIDYDALVTATEFAVRDGAAGTVLFRAKLPSGVAGSRTYTFASPLKGTANTLMEVITLTATGAVVGVFPNAQGFTGT